MGLPERDETGRFINAPSDLELQEYFRPKWEYTQVISFGESVDLGQLNTLGSLGWEVVSSFSTHESYRPGHLVSIHTVLLKRELFEKEESK